MNVARPPAPEIDRLLAQGRLLDTPTCSVRTIELASYWPDCIKTLGERFSYASPWHYQNVDICRPFDQAAPCRDGNCVSAQIERNVRLLADARVPTRERLMALAFLVHFMGDLHQPMHAGDHGDLGGNRVPVSYGAIAGRTNLHMVWDGYLADRGISQPPGGPAGILSELSPADRAAMREGAIADWARESWAASREFAYGTIMADPCGPAPRRAAGDHRGDHAAAGAGDPAPGRARRAAGWRDCSTRRSRRIRCGCGRGSGISRSRHCEERSDEAIQRASKPHWIASLRSQ